MASVSTNIFDDLGFFLILKNAHIEYWKVDGEFSKATVGHVVQLLNDPALPMNLQSKLLSILGQCHSNAAVDVLESLKLLIKG